ncbi:hypothetical protein DERF_011485 [Dermatophagoides farinae]|uniref:Uncharacterized protein n=1 Tax=Dermatophagoides farinae TaxID=6954 RepID=A0A922L0H9_DERFA|nr:hypothetical protein DERF_011485 [Dermatophagoides farinae]
MYFGHISITLLQSSPPSFCYDHHRKSSSLISLYFGVSRLFYDCIDFWNGPLPILFLLQIKY